MLNNRRRWLILGMVFLVMTACSTTQVEEGIKYSKSTREHLYDLGSWSFSGRLALTGKKDAWQANIVWAHDLGSDEIKLSGPLGQGATVIRLSSDEVIIDRGDGKVLSSRQPEDFISQQLGLAVPVRSLRYWVVGLPEPSTTFVLTTDGFVQSGWLIEYKQEQVVNSELLPRKISVTNERVKLKLMIDQWGLNDAKTK
ncbi:MAG: lipoprotein insertase outer membrane protein LolB [Methylococcales bacterium]